MKLSDTTLATLKNFAGINSNIVLNSGNVVKTMSESKTIMSSARIDEYIPSQIGIYDLSEFLGVIGMFDDPDLLFDNEFKSVKVSEGRRAVNYFFSEPSILTTPRKDITMPSNDITFDLTADDMSNIRKGCSTLGVSDVVIKCEPGSVPRIVITDTKDKTSNSYAIELADLPELDITCEFIFNIVNFKFVNDDYAVTISKSLISNWKAKNSPIEYWVALEKNSTFRG